MQACGQQGLQEQEDCVAEDELDEITHPQVAPEPEEVFARLLKRVHILVVVFPSRFKVSHLFSISED